MLNYSEKVLLDINVERIIKNLEFLSYTYWRPGLFGLWCKIQHFSVVGPFVVRICSKVSQTPSTFLSKVIVLHGVGPNARSSAALGCQSNEA